MKSRFSFPFDLSFLTNPDLHFLNASLSDHLFVCFHDSFLHSGQYGSFDSFDSSSSGYQQVPMCKSLSDSCSSTDLTGLRPPSSRSTSPLNGSDVGANPVIPAAVLAGYSGKYTETCFLNWSLKHYERQLRKQWINQKPQNPQCIVPNMFHRWVLINHEYASIKWYYFWVYNSYRLDCYGQ